MMKEAKKWSVYFQNPEYLERTRMFLIAEEMKPLVRRWCGLRDGMNVLDVGCGTGYFTRLLASGRERIRATGLDLEEPFIAYAREKAKEQGAEIAFVTGNALALPFEEHSFDLVASHTFFTSIPEPDLAMAEMKRVCRDGGTIASVTAMSFLPSALAAGQYPSECKWVEAYRTLSERIHQAYYTMDPLQNRMHGVKPTDMPRFFVKSGLKNVCAYPLGKVFSLSNGAVSREEKLQYIDLFQSSEEKRLDAFMALPETEQYITGEMAEQYRSLVREKCDWHRAHPDENSIWDWQGDANILVTGRVDKGGMPA